MRIRAFLLLVLTLCCGGVAVSQTITIAMSIKVIVNPTNGAPPAGITNELFYRAISNANRWMESYWRGYRFGLAEIVTIGGVGDYSGPSKWFVIASTNDIRNGPASFLFQEDIRTNAAYFLRSNLLNFYVYSAPVGNSGGACPTPPYDPRIACWGLVDDGAFWVVHETGHFFGLSHTFGACTYDTNCLASNWQFNTNGVLVGDDNIGDTLLDFGPSTASECNSTNLIALANFAVNYAACSTEQQRKVDDTLLNVMSYHNWRTKNTVESRLSETQLDLQADTANGIRRPFVSGHTWFVDPYCNPFQPDGSSGCGADRGPYQRVADAIASASREDIVLLRPGNYNERVTINRPVTLRATRTGWATIGR